MYHAHQQHKGANQHYHALHGVVKHAGAESAKGGIERNTDPKNQQARFIGNTGCGFKQARAADKLHGHSPHEGHQQAQAGQPDQQAALVAGKEHVIEGNGIIATRQDSEFLPQNAQREPDGGELDHRQQYPAQPIFIGRTRTANKGAGADIGGGQGHRQHNTAHRAAAKKILVQECARCPFAHGVNREAKNDKKIRDEGQDHFKLHYRHPPAEYRDR